MKFENADDIVRQLSIHGYTIEDIVIHTNQNLKEMLLAIASFIEDIENEDRKIFKDMRNNAKSLSENIKTVIAYREENKELLEATEKENRKIMDIILKLAKEEEL